MRTGLALLLALVAAVACGGDDDDGPMGLDPNEFELSTVSGGGQSGIAGTVLLQPLVVEVRNRSTGAPREDVTVSWQVAAGGGEPTRTTSATADDGQASTRVQLSDAPGSMTVEANVEGLPAVEFSLTSLPAPELVGVTPTSVSAGDTVEVRVSNLPVDLGVQVLFNGERGTVAERIAGSPTVLRTVVPPPAGVCSQTTRTVPVRVRVGGVTTAARDLDVAVPDDPFRVGQVLVAQGSSDVDCALLPADGGIARYLLVALSAAFETSGNFKVTLGGSNVAVSSQGIRPEPRTFHGGLRALEQELVARGLAPAEAASRAALFAQPEVGSQREFWVLNNVEATQSGSLDESDFDRITATLKFKGVHTLLYVDDQAPANGLTQADLDLLGEVYDRALFDADVDFFGEPTDLDENDRVIVLLSPVVNALTDRGSEGVIVGFFFGLDLFNPNQQNCAECRFSNGGELFYGIVPDPNGEFSDERTRERVKELLPGVMVHETQHMINFRFKIFVNGKTALENLWLAEAEAHMAEELGGDEVDALGMTDLAEQLYEPNFGRALRYLMNPGESSLTVIDGGGTLGERGAAWLFGRWLAEQYGDFIFRDLTQAAPDGVENVEAQTGEEFFRLFADWAVAMWADDQDIPGLAERYQVPKWRLRDILRVQPQGGGDPVYALQPIEESFSTFRSDSISEFLAGSSPFYVELSADGATEDLQLELTADDAAGVAILRFE